MQEYLLCEGADVGERIDSLARARDAWGLVLAACRPRFVAEVGQAAEAVFAGTAEGGDAFLDVGANIGYYSILASRLVGPSGSVVAVEPSPSIRRELLLNIDLNGADNVRVVSEAASDRRGEAVIYRAGNANRGSSSLLASRGYAEESVVQTLPLSDVLSELEFSSCRLIKVDVEGHEMHVLDGLIPLLASSRPDLEIVIEISGRELELEGASVDALFKKMGALGFLPYLIENDYHPHRYIANDFARKVSRLCAPPDLEVAFDVVVSRTDADSLAVVSPC